MVSRRVFPGRAGILAVLVAVLFIAMLAPHAHADNSVTVVSMTELLKERSTVYYKTVSPCGTPIYVSSIDLNDIVLNHPDWIGAHQPKFRVDGVSVIDYIRGETGEAYGKYILYINHHGLEGDKSVLVVIVRPDTPDGAMATIQSAVERAVEKYGFDKALIIRYDLVDTGSFSLPADMRGVDDAITSWLQRNHMSGEIINPVMLGVKHFTIYMKGGASAFTSKDAVELFKYIRGKTGACIPLWIAVKTPGQAPQPLSMEQTNQGSPEPPLPAGAEEAHTGNATIGALLAGLGSIIALAALVARPW